MSQPEERYVELKTKILSDGRVVYRTAIPITITTDPLNDVTVVANERDRLDIIAHNVYGDASQWWRIAAANKHVNGSLHILPGESLIIPRV
jgi:nucleoid-associated protein YgaU